MCCARCRPSVIICAKKKPQRIKARTLSGNKSSSPHSPPPVFIFLTCVVIVELSVLIATLQLVGVCLELVHGVFGVVVVGFLKRKEKEREKKKEKIYRNR